MKNILCFGDSNTWGYDYTTYDPALGSGRRMAFDERWPGIVQNMLGSEYRIIEDALNARTNMVEDPYFPHRLGLASLETALDAQAPLDLVIIQMGVNELKHMFNMTAGMISFGVEKLVAAAQASYYGYPAPKVLLIAPAPVRKNIADMIFGFSYVPWPTRRAFSWAHCTGMWLSGTAVRFWTVLRWISRSTIWTACTTLKRITPSWGRQ